MLLLLNGWQRSYYTLPPNRNTRYSILQGKRLSLAAATEAIEVILRRAVCRAAYRRFILTRIKHFEPKNGLCVDLFTQQPRNCWDLSAAPPQGLRSLWCSSSHPKLSPGETRFRVVAVGAPHKRITTSCTCQIKGNPPWPPCSCPMPSHVHSCFHKSLHYQVLLSIPTDLLPQDILEHSTPAAALVETMGILSSVHIAKSVANAKQDFQHKRMENIYAIRSEIGTIGERIIAAKNKKCAQICAHEWGRCLDDGNL